MDFGSNDICIFLPFSLFVSVYVYASVCHFVGIALLLPFVLGFCLSIYFFYYLKIVLGLPWWRSGCESACQCRAHGFEPWSGRIPHAAERLGPWATTTEPARLELVLRNRRGCDGERPAHRDEEWLLLAVTGESPRTETKTQHSQK